MRVGWRQRIEQAYRFEVALELVRGCDGPILDVGAGLGAMAEYAAARGIARPWWAIEPRPAFASAIREAGRYARVFEGPFDDADPEPTDCAVALGVLTARPSTTVARLAAFLARSRCSVFTVLDRVALAERPLLAAEHDAAATTREVLESLQPAGLVVRISSTDYARFVGLSGAPRTIEERFEATLDGPWAGTVTEGAWLACELGLDDRAEVLLSGVSDGEPLAVLVRERLALNRRRGAEETP